MQSSLANHGPKFGMRVRLSLYIFTITIFKLFTVNTCIVYIMIIVHGRNINKV